MGLLIALFPFYILGNLHCLGMCGPLVLFLGRHRYRFLYLVGRLFSFTLAGGVAGGLGAVVQVGLKAYHLSALACFLFGVSMLGIGSAAVVGRSLPTSEWMSRRLAKAGERLSLLLLKDQPWPTFLFGFGTLFLPCGQTLFVFSACALSQDLLGGLLNGFAFALLTSPSLWLAMNAPTMLRKWRGRGNGWLGTGAFLVALLAFLRGFADLEWIPHLTFSPSLFPAHIAFY